MFQEELTCPNNLSLKISRVVLQLSQGEFNLNSQLKEQSNLLYLKLDQLCQEPNQWRVNLQLNLIHFLIQKINSPFQTTSCEKKKKNTWINWKQKLNRKRMIVKSLQQLNLLRTLLILTKRKLSRMMLNIINNIAKIFCLGKTCTKLLKNRASKTKCKRILRSKWKQRIRLNVPIK